MRLIDSHCHIDLPAFDEDREQILEECTQTGVERMVVPGVHASTWEKLLEICAERPQLYPALGLHPLYCMDHQGKDLRVLEEMVAHQRPVAIGEIGLDFYKSGIDRPRQLQLFESQLAIAREADLPVILHVRKAHEEVIQSLQRYRIRSGICHAFNGTLEQAKRYRELGIYFGFGGMVTYPHSSKLRRLASKLPLESLVLESDAPDMSPLSHHEERNSPLYLTDTLDTLTELREESREEIAEATSCNTEQALALNG